jgi:hypothetical protein
MTPAELVLALAALQAQLAAHAPQIYNATGLNAYEYIMRLDGDITALRNSATANLAQPRAELDRQLAQDLLDGKYRDVGGVHGATAVWMRLPHNLPPESVAIYVPQNSADPSKRAIVMFLHGAREPETDIVRAY